MTAALLPLSYLLASILFIFAIRGLASPPAAATSSASSA